MISPTYISGLELSGQFFQDVVKPILDSEFPTLQYDAALIGSGSEVLGFDDAESTDHHWGPRIMLFVSADDCTRYHTAMHDVMAHRLPYTFRGYSTHSEINPLEADKGVLLLRTIDSGPINHRVEMHAAEGFLTSVLGINAFAAWSAIDWLLTPQQILRALTAGRVYHGGLGSIPAIREKLAYYPYDVWLYMLSAGWMRLSQEEPFMGRTGHVGDEAGSRIVAARLCRDLVYLGFLIERQYAPYTKWLGTAFARLAIGPELVPVLERAMAEPTWQAREESLVVAYEIVAERFNRLRLCPPLPPKATPFWGRPYRVIHGERFSEVLDALISDPEVRALPSHLGGIDQWVDNTDVTSNIRRCRQLASAYQP